MLGDEQIARYSRQIILPQVGGKGQQRLLSAAVALVGRGEMATTAALYLAAAGVGALTLAGAADGAAADLETLNADCHVLVSAWPDEAAGADDLARGHEVVIAADVQPDMALHLNAACVARRKRLLWGRAEGGTGWMAVLAGAPEAACFGCLERRWQPPPLPQQWRGASPVVRGGVAAFIGTLQATAVIQQMLDIESTTTARFLTYDALEVAVTDTRLDKDPHCLICRTGVGELRP